MKADVIYPGIKINSVQINADFKSEVFEVLQKLVIYFSYFIKSECMELHKEILKRGDADGKVM
jgi:hypothetical protein